LPSKKKVRAKRPEPAIVAADGTRTDAAEWAPILGDDRRPWDLTVEQLAALQDAEARQRS
jgi:hypothetical protein